MVKKLDDAQKDHNVKTDEKGEMLDNENLIYVVHEIKLEDDDHYVMTGIFTELELAKSVEQEAHIEKVIIKEMISLDGQFVPTGFSHLKEREFDGETIQWSSWIEAFVIY